MRSYIALFFSRWKSVALCLVLTLTPPAAMFADTGPTDADNLRQEAVAQYIDGASKELEAYGRQISTAARPENQDQYREAKTKLDECNALVSDLKTADPKHFDGIKAKYERTRGELVKALQAAQGK